MTEAEIRSARKHRCNEQKRKRLQPVIEVYHDTLGLHHVVGTEETIDIDEFDDPFEVRMVPRDEIVGYGYLYPQFISVADIAAAYAEEANDVSEYQMRKDAIYSLNHVGIMAYKEEEL
jgi:hypothetical protein